MQIHPSTNPLNQPRVLKTNKHGSETLDPEKAPSKSHD